MAGAAKRDAVKASRKGERPYSQICTFICIVSVTCALTFILKEFLGTNINRGLLSLLNCQAADNLINAIRDRVCIWYQPRILIEFLKLIGLISTLISLIYSHLGDKEMGVENRTLLKWLCPFYHVITLLYLGGVVVCFWSSHLNHLELSFLSFLIVISGIALQWLILYTLVLNREKRAAIALEYYEEKANILKHKDIEAIAELTAQIAEAITPENINSPKLVQIYTDLLYEIAGSSESEEYIIRKLESTWNRIWTPDHSREWVSVFKRLAESIDQKTEAEDISTRIYVSLFLSMRTGALLESRESGNASIEELQRQIIADVLFCERIRTDKGVTEEQMLIAYSFSVLYPCFLGNADYASSVKKLTKKKHGKCCELSEKQKVTYACMLKMIFGDLMQENYVEQIWLTFKALNEPA